MCPCVGTDVERGDTVTGWVRSGKRQATVPDVTQMTRAHAQAALTEADLILGAVTLACDD